MESRRNRRKKQKVADFPTIVFNADGSASINSGPIKSRRLLFYFNFHDDLIQTGLNQLDLTSLEVPTNITLHANQLPADVFKDTDPSEVSVDLFKTRVIEHLKERTKGKYDNGALAPNVESLVTGQTLAYLNFHYWFKAVATGAEKPLCHLFSFEGKPKCKLAPFFFNEQPQRESSLFA